MKDGEGVAMKIMLTICKKSCRGRRKSARRLVVLSSCVHGVSVMATRVAGAEVGLKKFRKKCRENLIVFFDLLIITCNKGEGEKKKQESDSSGSSFFHTNFSDDTDI